MRADHDRLASLLTCLENSPARWVWLHPSFLAVFLYRIASYLHRRGHTLLARMIWQFNMFLTGADINAAAELGAGLVVMNPAGTAIMGKIGRNFTAMPCSGVGGETGRREDIGAGPGLAVVGDDVVMEPHSGILGPIRVGDRARIGAGIAVTKDVPADMSVEWPKPRFLRRRDLA
jgi:serine O-acetyltransferase